MWEKDVDINKIQEIRVKTNVFFGAGAITKIEDIASDLKKKGIDKVIVVSGRNAYKSTGAWDYVEKALNNNGIGYVNYAKVTPNPTTAAIDEATAQAKEFGAKAVSQLAAVLRLIQEKALQFCLNIRIKQQPIYTNINFLRKKQLLLLQ